MSSLSTSPAPSPPALSARAERALRRDELRAAAELHFRTPPQPVQAPHRLHESSIAPPAPAEGLLDVPLPLPPSSSPSLPPPGLPAPTSTLGIGASHELHTLAALPPAHAAPTSPSPADAFSSPASSEPVDRLVARPSAAPTGLSGHVSAPSGVVYSDLVQDDSASFAGGELYDPVAATRAAQGSFAPPRSVSHPGFSAVRHPSVQLEQGRNAWSADSVVDIPPTVELRSPPRLQLPPHTTRRVHIAPQLPPSHSQATHPRPSSVHSAPSDPSSTANLAPSPAGLSRPAPTPASPITHDHAVADAVSPASLRSLSNDSITMLGSYPDDSCFLRKPLSLLLTPPDHLAISRPLAHLSDELSAVCRDHVRQLPRTVFEFRAWAAETDSFETPFEVTRRLFTIFRFLALMRYFTMDGWATGALPGDEAPPTIGPAPRGSSQRDGVNVHRDMTTLSTPPATPMLQPSTDDLHATAN